MLSFTHFPHVTFSDLLVAFFIFSSMTYANPIFKPTDISSVTFKDPRSIALTESTDLFTGNYEHRGWKVRYFTVEIPVPIDIAQSQIGAFYYKLRNLVPGVTQSTLIAEPQDTVHLGGSGGLWLNIRSENKVLNSHAIYQVLDVLIEAAADGWAPLFNAE